MQFSKCVFPILGLYLLLEDLSAFLSPVRLKQKRDVEFLDQEFFPHLSELSEIVDLSPGDDSEPVGREGRNTQTATFHAPLEILSANHHHNQYRRKPKNKRKKVSPLDSIGRGSLLSSYWSKKDEPADYRK